MRNSINEVGAGMICGAAFGLALAAASEYRPCTCVGDGIFLGSCVGLGVLIGGGLALSKKIGPVAKTTFLFGSVCATTAILIGRKTMVMPDSLTKRTIELCSLAIGAIAGATTHAVMPQRAKKSPNNPIDMI